MEPVELARVTLEGEDKTRALASALGARLTPGCVLALAGDLGAGKTTFVRGLAEGMGIEDPVSSPTYTLMHSYQGRGLDLFHYDAWMEGRQKAVLREGGDGVLDTGGVVVVEWAPRVAQFLPDRSLQIEFQHLSEEGRLLVFKAVSDPWAAILAPILPPQGTPGGTT
ncbi:MAG: tRNA (adenosine(37)-N6)-threonylcarbamoyltransferase complex ATPase subunit type 1 TsaE [Planctomycetota bacterium]|nr:tRNA (adenosine(37)-N6)-threonylcarbamoyltransferase complex ATPase subunit type 1 TsaE [Planctomycetota bacterium]